MDIVQDYTPILDWDCRRYSSPYEEGYLRDIIYRYNDFYIKPISNKKMVVFYHIMGCRGKKEEIITCFLSVEEAKDYLIRIEREDKLATSSIPSYHSPFNHSNYHTHYNVGRNGRLKKAERRSYRKLRYF